MSPSGLRPPACLIIGAAKAGTTSLYNILASHPQIAASSQKETRFFSDDDRFANGMGWYTSRYFAKARPGTAAMEASPAYLTWSGKVAPRIREAYAAGGVALVAILRDPVARAYSHYCHRVRLGHERLSFADAVAREETLLAANWERLSREGDGRHGYMRASAYASRLRPYFEHFERSRMLFLLQEDLRPDRFPGAMVRLLRFLEVDGSVPLTPVVMNAPVRARHLGVARLYWRLKKTVVRPVYTTLVPAGVRRAVPSLLFTDSSNPPLDPELAQRLRVRLADEVRACQDLIQRDLSHWLPS